MTRDDSVTIHRYLDEVFAGAPLTAEVQDLKEELRGSLATRVSELEASGMAAPAASRKAIKELGDIREILAQIATEGGASSGILDLTAAAYERNKVRSRPGFVVRTLLFSLAALGALIAYLFALDGPGNWGTNLTAALAICAVALPIGVLVADALRQETTSNHPLPAWRAMGYGAATAVSLAGLLLIGRFVADTSGASMLVAGIPAIVAGSVLFAYLGATQTNRKKAWAKAAEDAFAHAPQTRLEQDPVAAARFGIYSGVLWISGIGAFIALSIEFGFAWSWVAFLVALLIQMILIARMVFPDDAYESAGSTSGK